MNAFEATPASSEVEKLHEKFPQLNRALIVRALEHADPARIEDILLREQTIITHIIKRLRTKKALKEWKAKFPGLTKKEIKPVLHAEADRLAMLNDLHITPSLGTAFVERQLVEKLRQKKSKVGVNEQETVRERPNERMVFLTDLKNNRGLWVTLSIVIVLNLYAIDIIASNPESTTRSIDEHLYFFDVIFGIGSMTLAIRHAIMRARNRI